MSSAMLRFISTTLPTIMAGLVPAIHDLIARKTWMPATSAGMTSSLLFLGFFTAGNVDAQQRPVRLEIWDLKLGTAAADLPDEFTDYACGTNGGPPSLALSHWRDFRRCRPEPSGLREAYFPYDADLHNSPKPTHFPPQIPK